MSLLKLAAHFADTPGTCLLHSGGVHDAAMRSSLWLFPYETQRPRGGDPWDELKLDGRWIGYLGYEMGGVRDLPSPTPDFHFQKCAAVVWHDKRTGAITLDLEEDRLDLDTLDLLHHPERWKSLPARGAQPDLLRLASEPISREAYIDRIERVQEYIRDGEVYQMCLSQEYWLEGECDAFSLWERVHALNPAPFSAYLNLGDFQICSSSPERFLSLQEGILETRPIKGTMPRTENPERLLESEKERAELLMITDLMRNDLARVSESGTVIVEDLWRVEAYTNVYHLVSIIKSQLKAGLKPVDVLRCAFPGGSVTGCPKGSALRIIAEMEQRPRGVYTGSIGYIDGENFDFNIAIRTAVVWPNRLNLQLGGAITIESDPILEYEETLHKGASLFKGLGL